jgi:SAM-dependent methyltransferase
MSDTDPVQACLDGRIAPALAIARLLLAGEDADGVRRCISRARDDGSALLELKRLAVRTTELDRLRRMLDDAGLDHAAATTPAAVAALFDRAAAISPEGSVALYSLGDNAILEDATSEIVAWLSVGALLGPDRRVLDLGCGIGRIAAAVAPHVRSVHGIDVSAVMIEKARLRCAALTNVAFDLTAGEDLAGFADAAFNLVLAVDSFPYLVQAGVAERHVAEASRVLRPGGSLVVFNLSYRRDPAADRADAEAWSRRHGLPLLHIARSPFARWDAPIFAFLRPASPLARSRPAHECLQTAVVTTPIARATRGEFEKGAAAKSSDGDIQPES